MLLEPACRTRRPTRIGMITPSSNTVLEPMTMAITAPLYPRVTTHYTRIEVKTISLDRRSLAHFDLESMVRAAVLLADAGMDVIAWNGTSAAWRGVDSDRALCEAIARETGTPATTSTLAQIDAFRVYDVQTYALAVPYIDEVRQAIVATYATEGYRCVGSACLGISQNSAFSEVDEATIRDLVRRSISAEADALSIMCTNFPSGWLVEDLEATYRRPVFDSTVITVWHALRLAGVDDAVPGWGRLLGGQTGQPD